VIKGKEKRKVNSFLVSIGDRNRRVDQMATNFESYIYNTHSTFTPYSIYS
jgi:hypothetical protein